MPLELNDKNEIRDMLEENLKMTEEIYVMTKKIKNYVAFQKVMSFIYFLIIVVPIVLSIIFLPPLIKNYLDQFNELMGTGSANWQDLFKAGAGQIDLENLPPEIGKKLLESKK
jgi:hypothetical protein